MLIIKSFILTTYFLIQVAVHAAHIPLNARDISFDDSALFRKGKGTIFSMYSWSITNYLTAVSDDEYIPSEDILSEDIPPHSSKH